MRRVLVEFVVPMLLGAVIGFALLSGAHALTTPTSSAGPGQYGVAITTVTTLTVPQAAASAEICVEGAAARYTDDGTTPTASVGIPAAAGQCFTFAGALSALRIIGAGATMDVSFYR